VTEKSVRILLIIKFNALFIIWVISSYVSPSKAGVLARHFRRLSARLGARARRI
jgi:hypothetical protein